MIRSDFCRNPGRNLFRLLAALGCWLALGCGDPHAKLYRVWGVVTWNGQPVPSGKIYFLPDGRRNNSGPPGFADITDGTYDTSSKGGRGVAGGPLRVRIEGSDGTAFFFSDYETQMDLMEGSTPHDFNVPVSAIKRLPASPYPPP